MKKFWSVVNEVAGRTSDKERFPVEAFCDPESSDTSPSVENVCDSFNNFFASVGPMLAGALHPSDPAVVDDADHAASAVFDFRPILIRVRDASDCTPAVILTPSPVVVVSLVVWTNTTIWE
ncbi:hypothetical protein J6590_088108 [Homalodisca vitripennis]|nr:hypothetical protein J6590_088108 [Homalodisca vitripennis]